MKVILLQPEKKAIVTEIDGSLEGMQKTVGGYIEAVYPFDDPVAIVCNEEGKLNGLKRNRVLTDVSGRPYDILCGTAFLCGLTEDNFGDIPEKLIDKYLDMFLLPEKFMFTEHGFMVMRYNPEYKEAKK